MGWVARGEARESEQRIRCRASCLGCTRAPVGARTDARGVISWRPGPFHLCFFEGRVLNEKLHLSSVFRVICLTTAYRVCEPASPEGSVFLIPRLSPLWCRVCPRLSASAGPDKVEQYLTPMITLPLFFPRLVCQDCASGRVACQTAELAEAGPPSVAGSHCPDIIRPWGIAVTTQTTKGTHGAGRGAGIQTSRCACSVLVQTSEQAFSARVWTQRLWSGAPAVEGARISRHGAQSSVLGLTLSGRPGLRAS